jgi:hypothetical protein
MQLTRCQRQPPQGCIGSKLSTFPASQVSNGAVHYVRSHTSILPKGKKQNKQKSSKMGCTIFLKILYAPISAKTGEDQLHKPARKRWIK